MGEIIINEPIHINDVDFENKVLNSDLPVIVDFWAIWCRPCKITGPILDRIAMENAGRLIVAKIDVDVNTKWAEHYGIQGIPTVLFFYKDKLVYRQVGAVPEAMFKKIVEEFLYTIKNSYSFKNSTIAKTAS